MRLIDDPKIRTEIDFAPHDVKRFQEWLWLHGLKVEIDGILGPATRAALAQFRRRHEIGDEEPDAALVAALTLPMRRALEVRGSEATNSLGSALVRVAQMHAATGACEAPGSNRGPWVRLYGQEGKPWCAGFVSFLMRQATEIAGVAMPIPGSLGCDELAAQAHRTGRLVERAVAERVEPGDLFLCYRALPGGHKDYFHTGVVERRNADHLVTIEGNTNPSGGREGYEVERRIRSYDRKDFIRLG